MGDAGPANQGGVDVKSDQVSVGGDVVGRDKIVNFMQLDVQKLVETLKQTLPAGDPLPQRLLETFIELSATGGNGQYIFWVNGHRLPDVSNNQFIVESFGCQPVGQLIGVTSAGQTASQRLSIYSPLPNCPQ